MPEIPFRVRLQIAPDQDTTGGLIYMRARWYDPVTGRFTSQDPANQGTNWHAYCGGNPVNALDPSGQFIEMILSFFIGEDEYTVRAEVSLEFKKVATRRVSQIVAQHNARLEAIFRATLGEDYGISAMVKMKDLATGTFAIYHIVWDPFTMEVIHQHLH